MDKLAQAQANLDSFVNMVTIGQTIILALVAVWVIWGATAYFNRTIDLISGPAAKDDPNDRLLRPV